jgi:hypothetical protein
MVKWQDLRDSLLIFLWNQIHRTTFDFSLLGVIQKNGDFSQSSYLDPALGVMRSTMVFDAKGIEVLGNISLINFLFLQDTIYMFLI